MEINYTFELDTTEFDKFKEDIKAYTEDEKNQSMFGEKASDLCNIETIEKNIRLETVIKDNIVSIVVSSTIIQGHTRMMEGYRREKNMKLEEAFAKENKELFEEFKKSKEKSI